MQALHYYYVYLLRKETLERLFFALLVTQAVTRPLGILLVNFGLIEYPVRLYPKAVDSAFLHGFILNPTIFVIYYLLYPKQSGLVWKWGYTFLVSAIPVLVEVAENKYTDLVNYQRWSGYISWMLAIIFYYLMRKYADWYFVNVSKSEVVENED